MKLSVVGTITDEQGTQFDFDEKHVLKIEIESGNRKLLYEVNDEFKQNQKLRELIEKTIQDYKDSSEGIDVQLQKLLEESKK